MPILQEGRRRILGMAWTKIKDLACQNRNLLKSKDSRTKSKPQSFSFFLLQFRHYRHIWRPGGGRLSLRLASVSRQAVLWMKTREIIGGRSFFGGQMVFAAIALRNGNQGRCQPWHYCFWNGSRQWVKEEAGYSWGYLTHDRYGGTFGLSFCAALHRVLLRTEQAQRVWTRHSSSDNKRLYGCQKARAVDGYEVGSFGLAPCVFAETGGVEG